MSDRPITFEKLWEDWDWSGIPDCPGRYKLQTESGMPPRVLAGRDARLKEYRVPAARDPVVVAAIEGGGLISYRRSDGTYIHTLNTPAGFSRKLRQLGIGDEHSRE